MSDDFRDLLSRARAGHQDAAGELVGRVEPRVRAAVRGQLNARDLRRVLDSGDISQAVLAGFFCRAADGAFDLGSEDRLVALLVTMARNRVRDEARREQATRRGGGRRPVESDHLLHGLACDDPTPSRAASDRETVDALFALLPEDVRYLAAERAAGREWADLAAEVGGTPQAVRKRMSRAVGKAAEELGLQFGG